jgi:hypothetical protein
VVVVRNGSNDLLQFYDKILIGYNITILKITQTKILYKIEKNDIEFNLHINLLNNIDRINFIKLFTKNNINGI